MATLNKPEFTFTWRGPQSDSVAYTVVTRGSTRSLHGHYKSRTTLYRTREEAVTAATEALDAGTLLDTYKTAHQW